MEIPSTLHQKFRELGVATVYLFGSRAQGSAGPLSDYDFAILMNKGEKMPRVGMVSPLYYTLYDILSPFCPREFPYDILDIIFLEKAPLELQLHVIRHGKVIFDANQKLRANFEESVMFKTADFAPLRHLMHAALLARL